MSIGRKLSFLCSAIFLTGCIFIGTVDQNVFTQRAKTDLEKISTDINVAVVDTLVLRITNSGNDLGVVYLHNYYKEYCNNRFERNYIRNKFLSSYITSLEEDSFKISRLIPVIKDSEYIGEVQKNINAYKGIRRPTYKKVRFGSYFDIIFAQDSEKSISYPSEDNSNFSIYSEKYLFDIAISNFRKEYLKNLKVEKIMDIYSLDCGGNFESTLLLFSSEWRRLIPIKSEIFSVPSRDRVLITSADNSNSLIGY